MEDRNSLPVIRHPFFYLAGVVWFVVDFSFLDEQVL
jgi:hypothetical protein